VQIWVVSRHTTSLLKAALDRIFVFPHGSLQWHNTPQFMLFPAAYLIEMFGRCPLGGGDPYPEVNVPEVGWGGALTFAGGMTLLFFVPGFALVAADRLLLIRASRVSGELVR